MPMIYHRPVLTTECIEGLGINPSGVYVDATYGGGGHSNEILKQINNGRLFAFDRDLDSKKNVREHRQFKLINNNYKHLKRCLKFEGIHKVDGILADLGVSSHQLDTAERGFSYRFNAPLDMRMTQGLEKNAADVINDYSWEELAEMLRSYSDLKGVGKIARRIKYIHDEEGVLTTGKLVHVVKGLAPNNKHNKFLAQVFQALRIEVNNEMQVLKDMLDQCTKLLKPGGRLVVISYHSLEDRLVKNFMRSGNFTGVQAKDLYGRSDSPWKVITRKPIVPSDKEVEMNNRARSAKLRIAERLD